MLTSYGAQSSSLTPNQQQQLATLHKTVTQNTAATPLDPLTRSDRENELMAWLEDHAISNA